MKRNLLLAAAIHVAAASVADAHHSHPIFYDQCSVVTIEGRVERVDWKNPHVLVFVTTADGTTYTVDWAGLNRLTQDRTLAPAQAALVAGAPVVVVGNPIRTAAEIRQHFPDLTSDVNPRTLDLRTIRRADDSWSWALRGDPNSKPPDCKTKKTTLTAANDQARTEPRRAPREEREK